MSFGYSAPPGAEESADGPCCYGVAVYGAHRCTCWEPVYEGEQAPLARLAPHLAGDLPREVETRRKCCHDCAYRMNSPERAENDGDPPSVPANGEFWCHQGQLRAVAYRHPDGREIPAPAGDYQPPVTDEGGRSVVWRADGTPAARCAGWATCRTRTGP